MNNFLRGIIAAYGAKKLGGGCFSTILVFLVIWYALGHCGNSNGGQRTTYKDPHPTVITASRK